MLIDCDSYIKAGTRPVSASEIVVLVSWRMPMGHTHRLRVTNEVPGLIERQLGEAMCMGSWALYLKLQKSRRDESTKVCFSPAHKHNTPPIFILFYLFVLFCFVFLFYQGGVV